MIFGIGTDIVQIERISRSTSATASASSSICCCPRRAQAFREHSRPVRFLAMRFAAKEAIVKAMGTGFAHGMWIRDIGIATNAWGKPGNHLVGARPRDARRTRHRRRPRHADGRSRPGGRAVRSDARIGCRKRIGSGSRSSSISPSCTCPFRLRHRNHSRRRARPPHLRPRRPERQGGRLRDAGQAPRSRRARSFCRTSSIASSRFRWHCVPATLSRSGRWASPTRRKRKSFSASTTASRSTRRIWCRGMAAASICRCCTTAPCGMASQAPRYWEVGRARIRRFAGTTI